MYFTHDIYQNKNITKYFYSGAYLFQTLLIWNEPRRKHRSVILSHKALHSEVNILFYDMNSQQVRMSEASGYVTYRLRFSVKRIE